MGTAIKEYVGVCCDCFLPIREGEAYRFRPKGRTFHKRCAEGNPSGYYVRFEKRQATKIEAAHHIASS
jgi:hypothetical protein